MFSRQFLFVFLLLYGLLIYAPPLQNHFFHFDDKISIESNPVIKSIDLGGIFESFNTRFLPGLSFALNYALCGENPAAFRVVNVLIHVLNAFMVYLLVYQVLTHSRVRSSDQVLISNVSLISALIFLVHPIQTEAVNFITQRFVLMGSFFYLLSVFLYIRFRIKGDAFIGFTSLAAAVLSMFCKEFTVTLPLMLSLVEFTLPNDRKLRFKKRLSFLGPYFLIILIVPLLLFKSSDRLTGVARIAHVENVGLSSKVDITRAEGSIGRMEYFLTELRVVCTYIRLLISPINQNIDYDYPISRQIDLPTVLAGAAWGVLLAVAVLLYKAYPIISFSILWFFISLSVESSFIPIGHVIAEYRLYLPSVGFVMLAGYCLMRVGQRRAGTAYLIATVLIMCLSYLTWQRNLVWSDQIKLWKDTTEKSPLKARAYSNLSGSYLNVGDHMNAADAAEKAIALNPSLAVAYYDACDAYRRGGNLIKALERCLKANELNSSKPSYQQMLGLVYFQGGDFASALDRYEAAYKLDPNEFNANEFAKSIHFYWVNGGSKDIARRRMLLLDEHGFSELSGTLKRFLE